MSADDRIRNAFDDLADRTGAVDPHVALRRMERRPVRPRGEWRWALVAAVAVFGIVGAVAVLDLLPSSPDLPPVTDPSTTTTTVASTTTTPAPTTSSTIVPGDFEARFRTSSPTRLRAEPRADAAVVAELPAGFTGLFGFGPSVTEDGATWTGVRLADPVPVDAGVLEGPFDGSVTGWVDASALERLPAGLPVTAEDLPPCRGDGEFSGTGEAAGPVFVSSLASGRAADGCHRIVLGFSTGRVAYDWRDLGGDVSPASSLPAWYEAQGPYPLVVALPDTTAVWPGATTAEEAFVVRRSDGGLDLLVLRPAESAIVRTLQGRIVIDLVPVDREIPPAGRNVVLTRPVHAAAGTVEAVGIARPFEANLGVRVEDASGAPVEAVFSGSATFGTIRTDAYAVQTTDWLEAWAPFAVRAEGLDPGEYVLVLDPEGGSDTPTTLRVPFTITDGGRAEAPDADANEVAADLVAFAGGGPVPALADTVLLRLGNAGAEMASASDLADPAAWVVDAEEFNGWAGPFDLLQPLRDRPHVRVSEGSRPHCAAPAIDWWPGADPVRVVTLEPVGTDSCLEWYAVTARLDGDGRILEVVLDLWEP